MNKYRIAKLLLAITLIYSCTGEEIPSEITSLSSVYHSISVSKNSIKFGSNTDLIDHVIIIAKNTDWEISGCPEWLTLSQTSGHGTADIQLTARENKSADVTYADKITIQSLSPDYIYSKSISVSQEAPNPFITPEYTSVTYDYKAQSAEIAISSSVEWVPECSESWLTATAISNEKLKIDLTENQGGEVREAKIVLKRKGYSASMASIKVVQSRGSVTTSVNELNFDPDEETLPIEITADVPWTASASASWISVTPSSGQGGSSTMQITAVKNGFTSQRTGYVSLNIGNVTRSAITIKQAGVSIDLQPTTLTFEPEESSQSFTVTANATWKVISTPSWISLSIAEGTKGRTTITATVEANTTPEERTGKISLGKENYSVVNIPIKQDGVSIDIQPTTLTFEPEKSSKSFTVTANGTWKVVEVPSWISLSPSEGTKGSTTITATVEANTIAEERTGKIWIGKKYIAVTQDPAIVVPNEDDNVLPYNK